MVQSPSWENTRFLVIQDNKIFPSFYGTQRFITTLTSARPLSLSWDSSKQCIIYFLKIHLIINIPSTFGSRIWSFSSGFPTKTLYTLLLSPIHNTYPNNHILLKFYHSNTIVEEYTSFSFSLRSFIQSSVNSSLLVPNILLNTLFSNTTAYFPPSKGATNFLKYTKENKRILFSLSYTLYFWKESLKAQDLVRNDSMRYVTSICS